MKRATNTTKTVRSANKVETARQPGKKAPPQNFKLVRVRTRVRAGGLYGDGGC